jgi:transposase
LSTIEVKEEETMQEITTVGFDLAKNLFHLIGCNEHGKEVKRKMLKWAQVLAYFANLPPCLIGNPLPT